MVQKKRKRERRYCKIDPRVWGDEKFCRLTPIPPCGQGLWFYLLTGPHRNNVPGLFSIGVAGLAERLRWPMKAFQKAFQEGLQEGLFKYDPDHLVWSLPNVIKYDEPESPNVVTSWRIPVNEIPECGLKTEHLQLLRGFLKAFGEAFLKAFDEAFDEALRQSTSTSTTTAIPTTTTKTTPKRKPSKNPPLSFGFDEFWKVYPKKVGKGAARRAWEKIKMTPDLLTEILVAVDQQKRSDQWIDDDGQFIPHPASWLNGERWQDRMEVDITDDGIPQGNPKSMAVMRRLLND